MAPTTSTIRGLPSEVIVGTDEGLKHQLAIDLDQVQTADQSRLHEYVRTLYSDKMRLECRALAMMTTREEVDRRGVIWRGNPTR